MTRSGSYAKGRAKREEILRVALEVIARNGYQHSSLREIATSVGLTNAGLLHYFGSKEELFAEVLRMRDEVSGADEGLSEHPLRLMVDVVRQNAEVPGLVHLYSSLSAEAGREGHAAHAFFEERYARLRELVATQVERAVAEGRMRPDVDARKVARILLAVADGLQVQWLLADDFDMAEHVEYFLSLTGYTMEPEPSAPDAAR